MISIKKEIFLLNNIKILIILFSKGKVIKN